MKKLLLTLLFTASCYAHTNNPIQTELEAKQTQLNLLSEQIMKKEEELGSILKKIQDSFYWLKKKRQSKLKQAISDDEMDLIVMNDLEKFLATFNDVNNKKEQVLFDKNIFNELNVVTRFYIVIYMQENSKLEELIKKWAILCDEINALKN